MRNKLISLGAGLLLAASAAAQASTYTYKYVGPNLSAGTDHVEISFTTAAPLVPAKSYLNAIDAGVVSGVVTVVGPTGIVSGFTLPLTTFQIHTNGTASGTTPGIDAWFILGDASNLTGTAPTMTGVHFQSYSMNTMAFIPGSDIPGATGLVTGYYNYDQATQTTFYASCSGIAGCTLAGNGQPYVGNYSGIINPANTSAANWTLIVDGTPPSPPAPTALLVGGSLPGGTVGVAYASSGVTASGGVPPYKWSAVGLPPGLTIDATSGAVAGTPTTAATYGVTVTVADAGGSTTNTALSVAISAAAPVACSGTDAPISGVNKFWLDVNGGLSGGGQSVVYTPTPAGTTFSGTTGFAVGELIDYVGTLDSIGMCAATSMTVKPAPAPTSTYSCTRPSGAKSAQAKAKITKVGAGYIVVGTTTVQTPSCTVVSWNGATGFAVGQIAEYKGYQSGGITVAQKITIN